MKIQREKLFKFNNLLKALKNVKSTKFAYIVVKNTKIIDDELEIVKGLVKLPDDHKSVEFETKRMELVKKWAKKDENGNLVVVGNNYDVTDEALEGFNADFNALTIEYADALAEVEANNTKLQDLLVEEVDVDLKTIKEENLPDNLSAEELDVLDVIVV
jgi:hypothetical protein